MEPQRQPQSNRSIRLLTILGLTLTCCLLLPFSTVQARDAPSTSSQRQQSDGPDCEQPEPSITLEKQTNGVDGDRADDPMLPTIEPGGLVTWTYVVQNTSEVKLRDITVLDDQGVMVTCPQDTLEPHRSMTCMATGLAENLSATTATTVAGPCGPTYENIATVTGRYEDKTVTASDPSHYCNPPLNPAIDIEKATNGYDADVEPGPFILSRGPGT